MTNKLNHVENNINHAAKTEQDLKDQLDEARSQNTKNKTTFRKNRKSIESLREEITHKNQVVHVHFTQTLVHARTTHSYLTRRQVIKSLVYDTKSKGKRIELQTRLCKNASSSYAKTMKGYESQIRDLKMKIEQLEQSTKQKIDEKDQVIRTHMYIQILDSPTQRTHSCLTRR